MRALRFFLVSNTPAGGSTRQRAFPQQSPLLQS